MPWLAGTALIHSLAATEKRGLFKSWTVLLAIFAFSLSLLGTFLVRSGVLTSVHAFATDPARGLFILVFLGIVVGGSLVLYALRAPAVSSRVGFAWLSRESLLLVNNVVFLVATLTVLFGTLFPLLMDALGQGKYSVGPTVFQCRIRAPDGAADAVHGDRAAVPLEAGQRQSLEGRVDAAGNRDPGLRPDPATAARW